MKQFFTYILFISSLSFSQNIVLELDTNLLRIGERFNITVKSNNLDSNHVFWKETTSIFQDFEVLSQTELNYLLDDDTFLYRNFLLTSFDTGLYVIPSQPIVTSILDTIKCNVSTVQFLPVELDSLNRYFDIKKTKKIPFHVSEVTTYLFDFILILLFAILLYFIIKYLQKNKTQENKPKKIDIPIDIYFL